MEKKFLTYLKGLVTGQKTNYSIDSMSLIIIHQIIFRMLNLLYEMHSSFRDKKRIYILEQKMFPYKVNLKNNFNVCMKAMVIIIITKLQLEDLSWTVFLPSIGILGGIMFFTTISLRFLEFIPKVLNGLREYDEARGRTDFDEDLADLDFDNWTT
jgi:hypothetical protein